MATCGQTGSPITTARGWITSARSRHCCRSWPHGGVSLPGRIPERPPWPPDASASRQSRRPSRRCCRGAGAADAPRDLPGVHRRRVHAGKCGLAGQQPAQLLHGRRTLPRKCPGDQIGGESRCLKELAAMDGQWEGARDSRRGCGQEVASRTAHAGTSRFAPVGFRRLDQAL